MSTLEFIQERIRDKKGAYRDYEFISLENNAIMTFFDLAQEFDGMDDFYVLSVSIPKIFFGVEACLYISDPGGDDYILAANTGEPPAGLYTAPPIDIVPDKHAYRAGDSLVLTIRGKKTLMDQLPFRTESDVLGLLAVYPAGGLGPHQELFFEKYANRIGFNLHNRYLVEKNIEHLKFIKSLVSDIEHNIIVPNMVYKLFLRRLKSRIMKIREIEGLVSGGGDMGRDRLSDEISDVNKGLSEDFQNIERHYENMTLFLETLLRRSHFDQGRLTLRAKKCNMKKDILLPQLERYMEQFRSMGISIDDRASGVPEEEMITIVDAGLIAQVYANLFSNALKYTREITTEEGEKKKYIAYGHEVIHDYFGPGSDGIKYNVFSSGPHIAVQERDRIFEEGFRGDNIEGRPGTGHGLAFIKNAVEIHGGVVGYGAVSYGNNFYFILPK